MQSPSYTDREIDRQTDGRMDGECESWCKCVTPPERNGVSNHRQLDFLFNGLFRLITKKTLKLITYWFVGESIGDRCIPHKKGHWSKKLPLTRCISTTRKPHNYNIGCGVYDNEHPTSGQCWYMLEKNGVTMSKIPLESDRTNYTWTAHLMRRQ